MHSILYLFNALDELDEWACVKKNAILLNFGDSFYRNEDRKNKQDEKPAQE